MPSDLKPAAEAVRCRALAAATAAATRRREIMATPAVATNKKAWDRIQLAEALLPRRRLVVSGDLRKVATSATTGGVKALCISTLLSVDQPSLSKTTHPVASSGQSASSPALDFTPA